MCSPDYLQKTSMESELRESSQGTLSMLFSSLPWVSLLFASLPFLVALVALVSNALGICVLCVYVYIYVYPYMN